MKNTFLVCLASSALLTGCVSGGGNQLTGDNSPEINTPIALASFESGGGVIKADFTELAGASVGDVTKFLAITPNLEDWVNNLTAAEVQSVVSHQLVDVTEGWGGMANYYEGELTFAGQTYTVALFEPLTGQGSFAGAIDANGYAVVAAFGPKATNIPTGSFTYTGVNLIALSPSLPDPTGEPVSTGWGAFKMNVDFTSGTGKFVGDTTNINTTSMSGDITLNSNTGEFSGTMDLGGAIRTSLDGSTADVDLTGLTAALNGSFHGSGATNVTGLYYSDNGAVAGGFVGNR